MPCIDLRSLAVGRALLGAALLLDLYHSGKEGRLELLLSTVLVPTAQL